MDVLLTDSLKRAVEARDVAAARSAILTEIRNDRTREFPSALKLADAVSKLLPGFYEADNGVCAGIGDLGILEDSWVKARSAMMLNFSRERLCVIDKQARELHASRKEDRPAQQKKTPVETLRRYRGKSTFLLISIIVIAVVTGLAFALFR